MEEHDSRGGIRPYGEKYTKWTDWFGDVVGSPQWAYFPFLHRHHDRDRGFLSKSDRQFLLETQSLDLSDKSQRNVRTRIRGRVLSAYFDANFLQFLSPRDRQLIFKNARDGGGLQFREGFKEFLRFSYLGLLEDEYDHEIEDPIEEAIKEAEEAYARSSGKNIDVDIEVNITRTQRGEIEKLEQRYTTHNALTQKELDVLVGSAHTDKNETVDAAQIDLADALYYDARQTFNSTVINRKERPNREEAEELVTDLRELFAKYDVETRDELEEAVARLKRFDEESCDEILDTIDRLLRIAPHFEEQIADKSNLSEEDASLLNDIVWNPDNIGLEEALNREARPRLAGDEWDPSEDEDLQRFIARIEAARNIEPVFTPDDEEGRQRWMRLKELAEFEEAEWEEYIESQQVDRCRLELKDRIEEEDIDVEHVEETDSWEAFLERRPQNEQTFSQFEYFYTGPVLEKAWGELIK